MAKENIVEYQFNKRTAEEQREIARMGGKASGEARREKASMKKMLEMCLNMVNKEGKSYRELATLGLIKGAMNGNANNYRTILETIGELNYAEEDRKQKELSRVDELLNKLESEANNDTK